MSLLSSGTCSGTRKKNSGDVPTWLVTSGQPRNERCPAVRGKNENGAPIPARRLKAFPSALSISLCRDNSDLPEVTSRGNARHSGKRRKCVGGSSHRRQNSGEGRQLREWQPFQWKRRQRKVLLCGERLISEGSDFVPICCCVLEFHDPFIRLQH
ncbi:hypothetical protein AVEN_210108-1 [Araneus ventricosus]|uniref:Uncharacterized protein n=1 Tax=Araneus ventricosus TaxID=182803 RepID=A0A4Y2G8F4_ARAVE|nr:hypothetical protein AVEN_210108-1 [Araneus ventricosus]